jgi:transcriptional repressor NrdR
VRCPFCSFESTKVVDSRLTDPGDSVRRRRECAGCGERFTTHERVEAVPIDVIKRDGTTQRFDRRKLLRGLVRAAGGRPVGGEQLEELADSIEVAIRRHGRTVPAASIGDLAERGLARLDPVTAIQFASVYRRLADLDELEAVVRKLREDPDPGVDQMPFDDPFPSDLGSNIDRSRADQTDPRREHADKP